MEESSHTPDSRRHHSTKTNARLELLHASRKRLIDDLAVLVVRDHRHRKLSDDPSTEK